MFQVRLAIPAILVAAAGCDPARTTSQGVLLEVISSASGQPVAGVRVSLKYDYERNIPVTEQEPEAERQTYEWFSSTTDVNGQANVGVVWTVLDDTRCGNPPPWRDWVSGVFYLVQVEDDQVHELFHLRMDPGASAEGQVFTLRVLTIQEPRYID
jgi:hypothetical protein